MKTPNTTKEAVEGVRRQLDRSEPFAAIDIIGFMVEVPLGKTTIYKEIKAGRIKTIKVGHRTLFPGDEPQKYLARLAAEAPRT